MMRSSLRAFLVLTTFAVWLSRGALVLAQGANPAPSPANKEEATATVEPVQSGDAGVDAAAEEEPAAPDPRTAKVEELMAGTLSVTIDPQSLFDVSLSDDAAIAVEATRIRTLLQAIDKANEPPAEVVVVRGRKKPAVPDAGLLKREIATLDAPTWDARVELDRARLKFYALTSERRAEVLRVHAARQEAAKPRETDEQRRARAAEAERQLALEAAAAARTESERLVSEELARLIALESHVITLRDGFVNARTELALLKETVLGWQRRVRDAKAARAEDADATYESIRATLRAARKELFAALSTINDDVSTVPTLGADTLVDVPEDISTEAVLKRRASVAKLIADTVALENTLKEERAGALLEEIDALNRERLGLLSHLTYAKRKAVTGFTAAGLDQARSEARHLTLILRYHRHAAMSWIASLQRGGAKHISPWTALMRAVPWVLLIAFFIWGRRRTPGLLRMMELKRAQLDRAERRTAPSLQRRLLRFATKVHTTFEWAAFFAMTMWLLPKTAQGLLEVQLLYVVIAWVLGGGLVVNVINALAAAAHTTLLHDDLTVGAVGTTRLRSLRLVGRTIVVFALILVLSTRLVGQGTIYSWVFSTCWFAAIPVFLVIVRWWREIVFDRMDRARKKTPLQTWVLSNRSGWKSFFSAMLGAVHLFLFGALKVFRSWLSEFDIARRIHAYFFKRELERLGDAESSRARKPLRPEVLEALHPERPPTRWLPTSNDDVLEQLLARVTDKRGGVVALVGARGMGKSAMLAEMQTRVPGAVRFACNAQTTVHEISNATTISDNTTDSATDSSTDAPTLVLLDDAHLLVKPVIGGLAVFDQVIVLARAHCTHTTWVVAIDGSIWPLLRRARDARPIFDETCEMETWDEEQIGALLADRCALAGITPTYEDILDKLPPGSDELDRFDALRAKQTGYERMLWDHVSGNPALALEAWRASLSEDLAGRVHVRPLQVPDSTALDRLPDSSLFILRAVLQLAPADVDDVAQATRLTRDQVLNAVRFGQAQGYFTARGDEVRVTWSWRRPVLRLLERRHLLVNS